MADEPWQRLAELIRRRREERRMSQRELGEAAGTTDRLVSSIERAERTTYKPANLRAISQALSWTPDSIERILAGGEPVGETDQPMAPGARITEDEALRRLAEVERKLAIALDEVERLKLGKHRPNDDPEGLPVETP